MTQTLEYDSTREKSWNRFSIIMFAVSCIFAASAPVVTVFGSNMLAGLHSIPPEPEYVTKVYIYWTMSFGVPLVGIITGLGASLALEVATLVVTDGGRVFLFDALFRLSLVRHLLMVVMKELSNAVAAILVEADADIAARRPVCRSSGRCCRFEEWGHRLYVTAAELLHFDAVNKAGERQEKAPERQTTTDERRKVSLGQFFATPSPQGCPYQVNNLCTAREARPLGCRIYFCDENAQSWQNDVYEKYHARLRAVHEEFGLPYRYLEWREALRELVKDDAGG